MNADVWPKKLRSVLLTIAILLFLILTNSAQTPSNAKSEPGFLDPLPQDTGSPGLKLELRRLQNTGRLMMVVAHPDDEDGGLLTRESRGQGVTTLLQTLTRGEGGQNKTGDTFSDELGILRVLELLAADRYYGVEDRFTRVADFGYSKTADETFQKWGGHDVPLADIVRTIRQFRPDVLIARFSGTEADGHGHHQASAILTKEAFRAAADPNRFPDQIKEGLQPWQPKKLYIGNVCGFGASTCPDENWTVKINTGEDDPLLGMSYVQFAIAGLRHQQSQGLGDIRIPSGPRYAFYKLQDSVLPNTKDAKGHEKDFFDGIDTTVAGLAKMGDADGEELHRAANEISAAAEATESNPQSAVAPLLAALALLKVGDVSKAKAPERETARVKLEDERKDLRLAIDDALNVELTASLISPSSGPAGDPLPGISPDQQFSVKVTFHNGSAYPLHLDSLSIDGTVTDRGSAAVEWYAPPLVPPHQNYDYTFKLRVPNDAPFTKPGFHRSDPLRDSIYTVDRPKLLDTPFISALPAIVKAGFNVVSNAIPNPTADPSASRPEISVPVTVPLEKAPGIPDKTELAVVPAFSVGIDPGDQVVPTSDASPIEVNVKVSSNLEGTQHATVRLQAPLDSKISPAQQSVSFSHRGEDKSLEFQVSTGSTRQGDVKIRAVLSTGNMNYSESYTLVAREDLGSFYYFQPAVQHISIVDVKIPPDLKVGYIMGAGDDISAVLREIGLNVTLIPADKIATENFSQFETIVLGVRAYDTQPELVKNNKKLLDFVSNGGTLIVQNNNSVGDFNSGHFTPYPAELSRARVSVEEAPVTVLDPGNPAFHYPNEISQTDFDGWVQERGLYFMSSWDDHFKPLLSCHDPGEPDQKGGLLMAKYGKGTYIYTGYSFFRQLPAGVPGAIRLFVNLVSAGHAASSH